MRLVAGRRLGSYELVRPATAKEANYSALNVCAGSVVAAVLAGMIPASKEASASTIMATSITATFTPLISFWSRLPFSFRATWIGVLIAALLSEVYEFLVEEILEFDSQKLAMCRGVHGWERRREYPVERCSDLGWRTGRRGGPYLALSVVDAQSDLGKASQRMLPTRF